MGLSAVYHAPSVPVGPRMRKTHFLASFDVVVRAGPVQYRAGHLLGQFGWVDFGLGCSTILPSCTAISANLPTARAEIGRGWNMQNQFQPN